VDSGRWREPQLNPERQPQQARHQQEFFAQLAACQFQVADGPDQRMRWSVPDGTRDPASGEALHDDWIIAAALCAQLEEMNWLPSAPPLIIPAPDPLKGMKGQY